MSSESQFAFEMREVPERGHADPGGDGAFVATQPLFSHLRRQIDDTAIAPEIADVVLTNATAAAAFWRCTGTNWSSAGEVVTLSLLDKLSEIILSLGAEGFGLTRPLVTYGVDSLLTMELRS